MIKAERCRRLGFDCACSECSLTGERLGTSEEKCKILTKALMTVRLFRSRFFGENDDDDAMSLTPTKARAIVRVPGVQIFYGMARSMLVQANDNGLVHSQTVLA